MNESKSLRGSVAIRVTAKEDEGLTTIDVSHAKLHEGKAFAVLCEDTNLATGSSHYISLLTNSAKTVHFRPALLYSAESLVCAKLYEGATITGGTDVEVFNHYRPLSDTATSDVVVKNSPTPVDVGTRLPLTVFAGADGQRQSQAGGGGSSPDEWVLKPDTQYLIEVDNIGSSTTDVTVVPYWYEVDY